MVKRDLRSRAMRGRNARTAFLLVLAIVSISAGGCDNDTETPLTLQVGPEHITSFRPRAAFGQYFELPSKQDVLRLVFASYPLGCDEYVPPGPGDAYITVTIYAPPTTTIEPGIYPWEGEVLGHKEDEAPRPYALPFVRLANEGRPLPAGGHVRLTKFSKEPLGLVEGQFAFRDGGQRQASTTALMGDFAIRLCLTELDPNRAAQDGP